jgi:16S rRNA processing protein RimM
LAPAEWVTLGKVTRVRGLKGELVVLPWSGKPESIAEQKEVYLTLEKPVQFRLIQARVHQGKVLLRLEGIQTPRQAREWVGSLVQMPKEKLPALKENEYYVHELVGLDVYTEAEEFVGQIKNIIANPGNDILQVVNENKEYYVPATKEAVKRVNLLEKKVIVKRDFVIEQ